MSPLELRSNLLYHCDADRRLKVAWPTRRTLFLFHGYFKSFSSFLELNGQNIDRLTNQSEKQTYNNQGTKNTKK